MLRIGHFAVVGVFVSAGIVHVRRVKIEQGIRGIVALNDLKRWRAGALSICTLIKRSAMGGKSSMPPNQRDTAPAIPDLEVNTHCAQRPLEDV